MACDAPHAACQFLPAEPSFLYSENTIYRNKEHCFLKVVARSGSRASVTLYRIAEISDRVEMSEPTEVTGQTGDCRRSGQDIT